MIIKCSGCGATLQNTNPDKPGFVQTIDSKSKYCRRCYRMMHYNELPKIVASNNDYERVIDSVIKRNGLMIFLVDIFQFKSTFHPKMIEKLRNKNVILVANKYDIFPKSVNITNIVEWLSRQCQNVHFKVDAIHIVSSKKGYYIDELMHTIDIARKERDVYFVGCANVGKSSLINALLKRNTSLNDDIISTSNIPGTTLNEIRIPFFDDNKAFIDTPGLINESDILNYLLPTSYKKIIPNEEMKPKTFQIFSPTALFMAGLSVVEFTPSENICAVCYTAKDLYIHRCKIENVEKLFQTQLGKLLNPPQTQEIDNLKYATKTIKLDGKKKVDLWFSGYGFISIIGKCELKVTYIENTEVYITNAIIG